MLEEPFCPTVEDHFPRKAQFVDRTIEDLKKMRGAVRTLEKIEVGTAAYDEWLRSLRTQLTHHIEEEETDVLPTSEACLGRAVADLAAPMMQLRQARLEETPTRKISPKYS